MATNNINISSNSPNGQSVINTVTLQERARNGSSALPYRSNLYDTGSVLGGVFPWHWHEEVECFYVREGAIYFCLQGERVLFRAGDAGFLNAGILHMTEPPAGGHCRLQNHIFLPALVCPDPENALARKYTAPLLENRGARLIRLEANSEAAAEARHWMDAAASVTRDAAWGWEFAVRSCMTQLWLLFLSHMPEEDGADASHDSIRLMQMVRFMEENYAQKLTLAELAAAAHISEKECERCFQRQIHMLPFAYLLELRLENARRLLAFGSEGITEIGARCGFASSSYFSKCFREKYNLSPRAYRQLAQRGQAD